MSIKRNDGRECNQLRGMCVQHDALGYADACVLLEVGNTKVLASITLKDGVPRFLRGQKVGWLTAEYAMLPCATQKRTNRESSQHYKNSRSVEISRLIGRSLRSVVDLSLLSERTIIIDCDVLQADGGTRVASITAAGLALEIAIKRWLNAKIIEQNILKEQINAVSVGVVNGELLLDLSYIEDSQAEADFNFVITKSGKLIEVQGTAEKQPLSFDDFESLKNLAIDGSNQIFKISSAYSKDLDLTLKKKQQNNFESEVMRTKKAPLFSLGNRLDKTT